MNCFHTELAETNSNDRTETTNATLTHYSHETDDRDSDEQYVWEWIEMTNEHAVKLFWLGHTLKLTTAYNIKYNIFVEQDQD